MVAKKVKFLHLLTVSGIGLASLLMLASFSIYLAPGSGWRVDGLRSGSMAPRLNIGDVVVTRPVTAEAVDVDDIIIFHSIDRHDNLISHRVTGIQRNSPISFNTKGDANEYPDPFEVPAANLVGELAFNAPLLGYAVLFLKTPSGLLLSLVIPGLVITAACLRSLRNELSRKRLSSGNHESPGANKDGKQ